jgi:hypothetical protein
MSDVEADLVIGLRKIAGVEEGSDFSIERDGVRIAVSYSGGSSSYLTLATSYDAVARAQPAEAGYRKTAQRGILRAIRPMAITLRDEDASDRQAKNEGLSREHQTGDLAFDEDVYVDSPTTDGAILDAVLSEDARRGALALFKLGFERVVLDDEVGNVYARISAFGKLREIEDAPAKVVDAFARLLSALPAITRAEGEHPTRSGAPKALAICGAVAFVTGAPITIFGVAGAYDCTESSSDGDGVTLKDGCGAPAGLALLAAIAAGFLVMFVVRTSARPHVAGHSDSHRQLSYVSVAAFTWGALATVIAAAVLGYSMMR